MKLPIEKKEFFKNISFLLSSFDTFIGERDSVNVKVPRAKLSTLS
jgi:hypothetical protein